MSKHFFSPHHDILPVQFTNVQLEEFAADNRPKIDSWINTGCSTSMRWRLYLKDCFVQQTLSTTKTWREILTFSAGQLKGRYKNEKKVMRDIDKLIKKHLDNKSPAQDFLKAKAYQWLKHLEDNPPTAASWYPHHAIEVAHKAFRMKAKMATFKNYISKPTRRKFLKSILSASRSPIGKFCSIYPA